MHDIRPPMRHRYLLHILILWPMLIIFTANSNFAEAQSISAKNKKNLPVVKLSAPEAVQELLATHFKLPDEPLVDETAVSAFLHRARQEISELLATEAYFTPTVTLLDRRSQKQGDIQVKVDPGLRTRVTEVNIVFQGDLASDQPKQRKRMKQLRANWPLKIGQPFRSADWEEAKAALLSDITDRNYAAAYIVKSQAVVDPTNKSAKLTITLDSGPVFYFGKLEITGLERYDPSLISNFTPFRIGEPYRRDLLHAFQLALQNVPHFNSISVSINPDILLHEAIPVQVVITETKSQRIAFGAGFSSNNGARGEINFRNYNFLDRAWNIYSTLRLEQKRQTFLTGIDTLPNKNNFQYSLRGSFQMTDIENLKTRNQKISFTRSYKTRKVQRQLSLDWQREEKQPSGGINQTNQALVLDWQWRYHQVDDPLHIRSGNVTEVRIGGGSQHVSSGQDFIRTYASHQSWWPIGKRDVFFLRGEAGFTLAESRFGIPQEYLFRAGGIHSVRGYNFLSLGIREGNAVVGGRALATGTLEYNRWFTQNWGAALFADIGSAADSWQKFDPSIGYGAGARWRSPAGPLALDLARAHETGAIRLHFSMAVAF